MSRKKIALVGGGQIGGILALIAAQKELGDIVTVDLPHLEDPMKGKALDLMALRPHDGYDVNLSGSGDYAAIAGADLVIVTAGLARKPGMTRDDLLEINLKIINDVAKQIRQHAPDAFVILTTNPLDAIVYAFHKYSGFPKQQVVGMAGSLDSGRFRTFIAMETGLSVEDVSGMVMGGHGPAMIPLIRTANVGGVPLIDLLTTEQIDAIVERTQQAGTEIVKLLGNGSAFYSPAAAVIEMAEAYIKDKKRVIPSAALCEGEYGVDGYFVGVPCVIGSGGVEKIIEFDLTPEEQSQLEKTLEAVKKTVEETGI
ncbi:MAG: malate dehydrogenase [Gammaproteobacteria bacterium]|nr:malate dehydrogenase [Gammaproteobacteria bacterium]